MSRHFTADDIQMAYKYLKKYSASLDIKKIKK